MVRHLVVGAAIVAVGAVTTATNVGNATMDVFTVDGTGHVTQSEEHAGTGTWVFRPPEPSP